MSNSERVPAYIVGIGASAGGLEALEQFFEKMPARTGLAFVVVQHLSPDFKSLTAELLGRRTQLPIQQVVDGVAIERDVVYLMPPKKEMIIANGRLLLADKDPQAMPALPIDHFFRSLAQDAGERAVAVVLSGTGSDGSRGIRAVHEAGGLVIAQAPESAKFDGMPRSALQAGVVAFTLPPQDMPDALLRYSKQQINRDYRLPEGDEPAPRTGMEKVVRLLRDAYDIDFSSYKQETVTRRIDRRLLLNESPDLDEYVQRLESDPEELNRLYHDLLIGVTRFFRDRAAFDRLAHDVLPGLIAKLGRDEDLRIWVAGCATGEEPYSLGILVQECFEQANRPVAAKIFATDVHRTSLDFAGAGIYTSESLADVSRERLQRFFLPRGDRFQVAPELRKLVVFAEHNVLKDAPFTRMDLITCRNLLIYFQPPAQKKVLSLFHFALKANGIVFLGPSESPGDLADEFDVLDTRWKIYRKRRDIRLPADIRIAPKIIPPARGPIAGGAPAGTADGQLLACYDALLGEYMPASLLVDDRRELVHTFGAASRYLHMPAGRFSNDVTELIDPELRSTLTGALQRTLKEQASVVYRGVRVRTTDGDRLVNLTVKPLATRRAVGQFALVCLEEAGHAPAPAMTAQEIDLDQASREHLQALEVELRYTKENLQATIEELETSNEELQATNEELVAANEELQSTNEELHSVNEELYTVNAEYQKKIAELTELTADMDNLLTSTQVHTLFLDGELCIRKYTPRMAETFNLLPQDIGRRIGTFTHGIDHPDLMTDLEDVLRGGTQRERQVQDRRGNWYLLRVLPYRAAAGAVEGVVLTLVDINTLKETQAAVQIRDRQLVSILRASPNLLAIKDVNGRYVLADDAYRRLCGCDPVGKTVHDIFPRETADVLAEHDARVLQEGHPLESEVIIPHPDGPHTYLEVKFPVRDESGRIAGVCGIKTDVTPLKRAEQQAREAVQQRDRFLAMLSHELRNPLAAVTNAAAVVQRLQLQPALIGEWIDVIHRRARHMARLLDDLLDVCRITQDKIEIRKTVFDLAAMVPDVIEEVRPRFEERRQQLTVDRPTQPVVVEGDPARLQQIQVNLLLNASKYTPVEGRITYRLGCENNQAFIQVRDTGVGIGPDMLDKVFDLFVQADNTLDRASGGIGVGLTLVRTIVGLHGGQVEAFSEGPGKGSEFVVRLPLSCQPLPAAPADGEAADAEPVKPLRLLVVEDDPDIRQTLRSILEHEGHRVQTAATGRAGLTALEEIEPDVGLIDIGLPEMDGYEVARRIRATKGRDEVRLIALTGYGQASDQQAAFAAGFDHHLTKPIRPRELLRLLKSLPAREEAR